MWKTTFRRLAATTLLGLLALGFAACTDQELETRTFRLGSLRPDEAQELIRPYVYEDRAGAPGAVSQAANGLTVREMPENLERIQAVLEEFDRRRMPLRLRFDLIYADGDTVTDPEIAEITEALRGVLRFRGYRLAGTSLLQVHRGEYSRQQIAGPGGRVYELGVEVLDVWGPPDSIRVHLGVMLQDPGTRRDDLLVTDVSAPVGETVVIGSAQSGAGEEGEAIILAVTPELAGGS